YGPELDRQTRWYRCVSEWRAQSWRVDETYLRVGGRWCYLDRDVTSGGNTLDFYLSARRTTASAKRFWAKTLRSSSCEFPLRVINTDQDLSLAAAITALKGSYDLFRDHEGPPRKSSELKRWFVLPHPGWLLLKPAHVTTNHAQSVRGPRV